LASFVEKIMENFNNSLYQLLQRILGIILITIGIAGLFLPILPGVIFIFAGLALLGGKSVVKQFKN